MEVWLVTLGEVVKCEVRWQVRREAGEGGEEEEDNKTHRWKDRDEGREEQMSAVRETTSWE